MQPSSLRIAILKKPSSGVSDAVFLNTGQVCLCAERVYVERPIFDRFCECAERKEPRACVSVRPLDTGDKHRAADLGDSIARRYSPITRLAKEEGATSSTGGGVPQFGNSLDHGFYVQPTILLGYRNLRDV